MSGWHPKRADDLIEDDRILLKDLRILTVRARPRPENQMVTIKYHELATKTYDELVVAPDQRVKVLCRNRCHICLAMDELI